MDTTLVASVNNILVVENSQLKVTLAEGLIGCEMWREFVLEAPHDLAPLMYLHSLDQADLTLLSRIRAISCRSITLTSPSRIKKF